MAINNENISNQISNAAKTSVSPLPTSAFPMDARTYFESYDDAVIAAASAKQQGSTESIYYYGLLISVFENDEINQYVITKKPYPNATNTHTVNDVEYQVHLRPISSGSSSGGTGDGSTEIDTDVLIIDGGNAQIAIEGWPDILDEIDAKSEEIQRLQEIINGLDSENEDQQQLIDDLNAEIERLRKEIEELAEQINESTPTPTPDTDVDDNGNITITDPDDPENKLLAGDFDGDGKVNNKDYGLLMKYLQGWDLGDKELNVKAVDFNKNSRPDATDLAILMKLLNKWSL